MHNLHPAARDVACDHPQIYKRMRSRVDMYEENIQSTIKVPKPDNLKIDFKAPKNWPILD
jgi:hypothetical protein